MRYPWPALAAERPICDDLRLSPVVYSRADLPGVEQHTHLICRTPTSYLVVIVMRTRPMISECTGLRSLN
jgi:hypothetical protein